MVLLISFLTIFLSLVAVGFTWQRNRAVVLFAGFITSYSLFIITHQIVVYQKNEVAFALLYNHFTPLFYLAGPLLYGYFRALVEDKLRFRVLDVLHLAPALLTLIGIAPYLFTPWSEKLHLARQIIADFDLYKSVQPNWLIPVDLNNVLRPLLLIGYSVASLRLLMRFKAPKSIEAETPLGIHYRKTRQWSLLVLITVMLMVISYLIPLFLYLDQGIEVALGKAMVWQIAAAVLFALLPVSLILYPNVIYGFIRFEGDIISVNRLKETQLKAEDRSAAKMAGRGAVELDSVLTSDPLSFSKSQSFSPSPKKGSESPYKDLDVLKEAILNYLDLEKPYLKDDFKAHDIAQFLNVPAHHISYCFANAFDENFARLKTRYRINHARELLVSGAADQFTLEAVGRQSGFASKSSFFTAFREAEGMTPQQFVDRVKQGEAG